MANHYTQLDHTADLRIRVTGSDISDLFKNAGLALFDLIAKSDRLESHEVIEVAATGDDPADLMVNFLRELLYLWTGDEKLVSMIHIMQLSNTAVSARVTTDRYAPERHEMLHEIKAVTYHQIDVRRARKGWEAIIVFDV